MNAYVYGSTLLDLLSLTGVEFVRAGSGMNHTFVQTTCI